MAMTGQQGHPCFFATHIVKFAQTLALHQPTICLRPRVDPSIAMRRFFRQAVGHGCCDGQCDRQRLLMEQLVFFALNQSRVQLGMGKRCTAYHLPQKPHVVGHADDVQFAEGLV